MTRPLYITALCCALLSGCTRHPAPPPAQTDAHPERDSAVVRDVAAHASNYLAAQKAMMKVPMPPLPTTAQLQSIARLNAIVQPTNWMARSNLIARGLACGGTNPPDITAPLTNLTAWVFAACGPTPALTHVSNFFFAYPVTVIRGTNQYFATNVTLQISSDLTNWQDLWTVPADSTIRHETESIPTGRMMFERLKPL